MHCLRMFGKDAKIGMLTMLLFSLLKTQNGAFRVTHVTVSYTYLVPSEAAFSSALWSIPGVVRIVSRSSEIINS